jgi:UPF0042 nucleotide-binding protein
MSDDHDTQIRAVLITGMSGAGRTSALKALEDMNFEAIDNVPLSLLGSLVVGSQREFAVPGLARSIAIGVDIRTRDFGADAFLSRYDELIAGGDVDVRIIFIDCDDEELRRRYEETRHRHPLAIDRPVIDGIEHERRLLAPLRDRADFTVDTTGLGPGALKGLLQAYLEVPADKSLSVFVTSFSFRRGVPRTADLVFDVRFLKNPHYDPTLRPMDGRDDAVGEFISGDPGYQEFFGNLTHLIEPLLPRYLLEGKSYLTVALGCTGGRHRSVFIAEQLGMWFEGNGQNVQILHRELDQPG